MLLRYFRCKKTGIDICRSNPVLSNSSDVVMVIASTNKVKSFSAILIGVVFSSIEFSCSYDIYRVTSSTGEHKIWGDGLNAGNVGFQKAWIF